MVADEWQLLQNFEILENPRCKAIGDFFWGIMVLIICTSKNENIFYATIFREIQVTQ